MDDGREMSLANVPGAGYGDVALVSTRMAGFVLLYFSKSACAEAERKIGSTGEPR